MHITSILESLLQNDIISKQQSEHIAGYEENKNFSIHWELRTLLLIGISLFTSGVGTVIYQNIDTIGHQVVIAIISCLVIACFYFVLKNRQRFSWEKVIPGNNYLEHALLLGCLLFLILEGYLQFQYNLFGTRYGLAIFIPTFIFFFLAYRFDHRGVLSMAITGLASWLGLTISPIAILEKNDFSSPGLILTGVVLGTLLWMTGWASGAKNLKQHFAFSYILFGGNLAAVAGLAGAFSHDIKAFYLISTAITCGFLIYYAQQSQSLLFLLMGVVYGYILFSYILFAYLPDSVLAAFSIYYFMFSSVGVIFFLLNVKKIIRRKK